MRRLYIACSLALALAGCSLALPRLQAPSCMTDANCARFNLLHPENVTTCQRYQCNEATNLCFLGPIDEDGDGHFPLVECAPLGDDCEDGNAAAFLGNDERCDGIDNDCDGIVDDGIPIEGSAAVTRSGLGTVTAVAWTADATHAAVVLADGVSATLDTVDGASAEGTMAFAAAGLEDPTGTAEPVLGPGCPSNAMGFPSTACTFERVAIAAGGAVSWGAFVNDEGCVEGQLRVGIVDEAAGRIELIGGDSRSNTWRGVDLVGVCTRAAGAAMGATAPAIVATRSTDAPTATVAWIRDRLDRAACPAPAAEVAVMGLWQASGTVGVTPLDWVVGTSNGTPTILGRTRGLAPPALAASGGGETFVAFGDEAGGVRVVVLGGLAPAPSAAAALSVGESVTIGTGDADAIAMFAWPLPGGDVQLGLAWTSGCGAAAELRFATLRWTRGARSLGAATPVVVAQGGATSPSLIFVPHGFVRPTFDRGRGPVGDSNGGWLVAWGDETMSPPAVVAARILEADGALLDTVALPFARDLSSDPGAPFLYAGTGTEVDRTARFAFHAPLEHAIVGGSLLCSPPP